MRNVLTKSQHNFDVEIPGWLDFTKKCEERVQQDRKEFGIKSELMLNPEICTKPSYLLLAMEPSGGGRSGVNFFPFFLHYCAYKYLCNGNFKYYITDLSKGGMSLENASDTQDERYKEWIELFKEEWELLSKPKIIVMGKILYNKINHLLSQITGFKNIPCINHYSGSGSSHIKKIYESIKKEKGEKFTEWHSRKPNAEELRKFRDKLREHLDPKRYPETDINVKNHLFINVKPSKLEETLETISESNRFAVYRYKFENENEQTVAPKGQGETQ